VLRVFINNWWLFACRAGLALVFATYVWLVAGAEFPLFLRAFAHASTVVLFGVLSLGAGIVTLTAALRPSSQDHGLGLLLLDGLFTCVAGAVVIMVPRLLLPHLVKIIGFWAVFIGIFEILMARNIRRHLRDEWFLAGAGIGSVVFGSFMLQGWAINDRVLLASLGWYALFSAAAMSGLAYRLWSMHSLQHRDVHSSLPLAVLHK